jgi:hypothetical protein
MVVRKGLLAFFLVAGCASRTEIVVGVATDLRAKGEIDLVRFVALRNGTPIIQHEWPLADLPAGRYELPGSFGLYSPDGSQPRVDLDVLAFRGSDQVVKRKSIVSLVSGQTLFMRLGLVGDCNAIDGPTCAADEACVEGVCRPNLVDGRRLPKFAKKLVDHVACNSGSQFIVSSTGTPMPTTGNDCDAKQFCQEGTCLNLLPGELGPAQQAVWVDAQAPADRVVRALWSTLDGNDVFAVGDGGLILHLSNGGAMAASSWIVEESGVTTALDSVYGFSSDDVWAVGAGGVILHRTGGAWQRESGPDLARLDGVWGAIPDELWAVGRTGDGKPIVLHRSRTVWEIATRFDQIGGLRAVWGSGQDDIWFAGPGGLVAHSDGVTITPSDQFAGQDIYGVGGSSAKDVFFVGRGGAILRLVDGQLTTEISGVTTDLFAVWVGSPRDIYAVGDRGVTLYSTGDGKWTQQLSGTRFPLFGVAGARNDLYTGGRPGVVLHASGVGGPPPCTRDADCAPTCGGQIFSQRYCASGSCLPKTAAICAGGFRCAADGKSCATSCADGSLCQAGRFCVDGTCCDTACNGACEACDLSGRAGTCTTLAAGEQPHGTRGKCTGAGTAPCGGSCDGKSAAACTYPMVQCAAATCDVANNYTLIQASTCAMGVCPPQVKKSCEVYACRAGACLGDCAGTADCASTYSFCMVDTGTSPKICYSDYGQKCTTDTQCFSRNCSMSGVCCDEKCPYPYECSTTANGIYYYTNDVSSCSTGTCTHTGTATLISCNGYQCVSGAQGCLTSCNSDADCDVAHTYHCNTTSHQCLPG